MDLGHVWTDDSESKKWTPLSRQKHVVYLLDLSTESGIQKVLWNFFKSGPPEAFLNRNGFVISRSMDSCPKTGCRHEED